MIKEIKRRPNRKVSLSTFPLFIQITNAKRFKNSRLAKWIIHTIFIVFLQLHANQLVLEFLFGAARKNFAHGKCSIITPVWESPRSEKQFIASPVARCTIKYQRRNSMAILRSVNYVSTLKSSARRSFRSRFYSAIRIPSRSGTFLPIFTPSSSAAKPWPQ